MKSNKKPLQLGQALCVPFIVLSILLLCGIPIANAQTPQQIAKKAFGSTVLLVMEDANGQPISLGSGFFVRNGQIATNLHVVEGAARGYAKLVGQKTKYDIEGITAIDPQRDLVILKVSVLGQQVLSLGDSDAVQIGESVYAVGNPRGLEGTFSQGIISSIREVGTNKLLQITAPISPGSSGGPVLNRVSDVIGVSVATFRGGQNLNFAIPSNYLKELLAQLGSTKPLSQAKLSKSGRSILVDIGGRSRDGVTGGRFTWTKKAGYKKLVYGKYSGKYSFSLNNHLRESVRNIYYLVIFNDKYGAPVDVQILQYKGLIPSRLAKRITGQVNDISVKEFSTRWQPQQNIGKDIEKGLIIKTRVEFRILDFEIVE